MMNKISRWFRKGGLGPGIFWGIVGRFFSNCGDLAFKLVSYLPAMQIAFMRVMLGTLLLVPWVIQQHRGVLRIKQPFWQVARVIEAYLPVWLWSNVAAPTSL